MFSPKRRKSTEEVKIQNVMIYVKEESVGKPTSECPKTGYCVATFRMHTVFFSSATIQYHSVLITSQVILCLLSVITALVVWTTQSVSQLSRFLLPASERSVGHCKAELNGY